jgi:hypothetical protein
MKPSREFCKRQILRLSGKPYSPTTIEAVGELIDTLHQHTQSEAHAVRTVNECQGMENCPDSLGIRTAAYNCRTTDTKPNPSCPECGGIGFKTVDTVKNGQKISAAGRCGCWHSVPRTDVVGVGSVA